MMSIRRAAAAAVVIAIVVTASYTESRSVPHTKALEREFHNHYMRVKREGSCRHGPRPRLVYVEEVLGPVTAVYVPRATVLHRCEKSTGCCMSPNEECVPAESEQVRLLFRKLTVNNDAKGFEWITFTNHTRCECADRNRLF